MRPISPNSAPGVAFSTTVPPNSTSAVPSRRTNITPPLSPARNTGWPVRTVTMSWASPCRNRKPGSMISFSAIAILRGRVYVRGDAAALAAQMFAKEVHAQRERPVCFRLAVGRAAVAGEGMVRARGLVDRHARGGSEPALGQIVDLGLGPAGLPCPMQHERAGSGVRVPETL